MDPINPLGVFISAFVVAALSGLAALLRSSKEISKLGLVSAILNSGLLGLGIALLWYNNFQENIYFLVGVCLLSGLGGMATVEFVVNAIRKGGFSIKVGVDNPEVKLSDGEEKKDV